MKRLLRLTAIPFPAMRPETRGSVAKNRAIDHSKISAHPRPVNHTPGFKSVGFWNLMGNNKVGGLPLLEGRPDAQRAKEPGEIAQFQVPQHGTICRQAFNSPLPDAAGGSAASAAEERLEKALPGMAEM